MSVEYESSCVECPSMGLPCQRSSCRNYHKYPVYSCDVCGDGGYLYEYGNQQLCSTHLRDAAWDDSPSKGTGKCEHCGEDGELREYADGRIGCRECIGEWVWEDAERVGDFIP